MLLTHNLFAPSKKCSPHLLPPPPPPPPPSPVRLTGALDSYALIKNIRGLLSFNNIVLNNAGNIKLTGIQYHILFTKDSKVPYLITTIKVPLLQITREAALYKDSSNSFIKQQVARLVPDLQKMATLHSLTEARQYHEVELVKLLHQEVVLRTDSLEVCGIFEGCRKKWYDQDNIYHFKIQGDKLYEVTINLSSFCSSTAEMRAVEKADPLAY
jgi:hypothetical protein